MTYLTTQYQQLLNLHKVTFSLIDHDDAMVAIVYKVVTAAGIPMILKISTRPKDFYRELYLLKHFAEKISVPRILNVVEPTDGVHGAILMECLPGFLLKLSDLTEQLAFELGSQLASIHSSRVSGYGDLVEPSSLNADPRIYFTQKFKEGFEECSGNLPKSLLERCYLYFDTHKDVLFSADGPCIIHRDFRPANIMVLNGKLSGIIDWASGRASFAQEDFCPFEHGEWSMTSILKNSFLAGYASIRPVPDYNDMLKLLRLNRAIATIGFLVKREIWQTTGSRIYQYNRQFLEENF